MAGDKVGQLVIDIGQHLAAQAGRDLRCMRAIPKSRSLVSVQGEQEMLRASHTSYARSFALASARCRIFRGCVEHCRSLSFPAMTACLFSQRALQRMLVLARGKSMHCGQIWVSATSIGIRKKKKKPPRQIPPASIHMQHDRVLLATLAKKRSRLFTPNSHRR